MLVVDVVGWVEERTGAVEEVVSGVVVSGVVVDELVVDAVVEDTVVDAVVVDLVDLPDADRPSAQPTSAAARTHVAAISRTCRRPTRRRVGTRPSSLDPTTGTVA